MKNNIHTILTVLILFAQVFVTACAQEKASGPEDRPNILLIIADDAGFTDFSCYGGEIPISDVDALATEGTLFTDFHVAPNCAPTQAANTPFRLTKVYPTVGGMRVPCVIKMPLPYGKGRWQLYNLQDYLSEQRDLSGEFPGIFAELKDKFNMYAIRNGIVPPDRPVGYAMPHNKNQIKES